MGRPARYDVDSLLDGAVSLVADGGPTAVTMSAVASAIGAPSGSVYHRFPTRAALLSALWLRTLERFHAGLLDSAAAGDPVAVAQHTITWSRAHPAEARVLLYGAADFAHQEWPPEAQQRLNDAQRRVATAFGRLGRRIGVRGGAGRERIVFALADIPLALVRRHLNAGEPIPVGAEDLVATTTRALLAAEP
jgi:AcrR family transcriptional regulator